jgi:hypothetical protein
MILWLNGTFGAGKAGTASELAGILPGARQFDPGWVTRRMLHRFRLNILTDREIGSSESLFG